MITRDPVWSFKFCLLEAEVLEFKGLSRQVVNILESQDRSFSPHGDLEIKQDLLLSLADARLGRPQRSVLELKDAQRLSQATDSLLQGEVLRTQGLLEDRSRKQSAAEKSYRDSLDFARKHNDEYLEASDLLNLGQAASQAEHIDEALDWSNASAQLAAKIHADVLLQSAEGNAGWAYYALGDFDGALHSFLQAKVQAQRLGATDSEILWLQSAGLAQFRLGDLPQAQARYEEALRTAQTTGDTARQARIDASLSLLFLQLQQFDAARAHAEHALSSAREMGDKTNELDASLLQAVIAARTTPGLDAERMLSQVLQDGRSVPSVCWEAEDALASVYAATQRPAQAESWHRRAIDTFEAQRDSVHGEAQRLPFFANGDQLYRNYADFLIASNRSDDALRVLDGGRARTLQDSLGAKSAAGGFSAHRVATVVPRKGTLTLFYSLGPETSYLWAVGAGGTRLFRLPPSSEIATRIKSYQGSILKSRDPIGDGNVDGLWLYDHLVAPAEALIAKDSRVLVIPDGPLSGFNLETLLKRGPQGLHYWLEDVSVTTASSIHMLSGAGTSVRSPDTAGLAAGKLLVMGDPLPASSDYGALPHAEDEVQSVQRYFPGERRTTFIQAAAVPAAYAASLPRQYAYLHFVAHGVASSLRPLDSAIILSPSPVNPDDFKLYARDIMHERLDARLVTISACYGSGVRNYAGEGLVGLSWAFLRAGAHQVIGALWEVNDSSTPQLMDHLYRGLAEGEQPDRALRAAKLSMVRSGGVFRKPLYWGAFQLYTGS